jgi:hypothetical protein
LRKAAKHSPRAIQVLVAIMDDEKQDPFARIAAAKLILDRGLGRAKELEFPPEAAQEEREVTPEELRYMERLLTIDNYQKHGWTLPPEFRRYEDALRILQEPDAEERLPNSQELGAGQSSKQLPEDATDEPNAVKNGSHHQTLFAQPTALRSRT